MRNIAQTSTNKSTLVSLRGEGERNSPDHHGDGEDEYEPDGRPGHVELVEKGVAERVDDAQVDVADGLHRAQLGLHEVDAERHEVVHHGDGGCRDCTRIRTGNTADF